MNLSDDEFKRFEYGTLTSSRTFYDGLHADSRWKIFLDSRRCLGYSIVYNNVHGIVWYSGGPLIYLTWAIYDGDDFEMLYLRRLSACGDLKFSGFYLDHSKTFQSGVSNEFKPVVFS